LHHTVVFVLAGAIIGVEEDILLPKAVVVKKEVQPTDHSICTLATITCLICQEVHLPGECLAVHTNHCTLPGSQEIDWPRLQGVRWIMDLLGVVKGIVHFDVGGVRRRRENGGGGVNSPLVTKYA